MDKKSIVAVANGNEKLMDGTTGPVIRILSENEIVFAVWQDKQAEGGVSTMLLKGQRRLAAIASEVDPGPAGTSRLQRGPQEIKWSAVKVLDREMAVAARQSFGEHE